MPPSTTLWKLEDHTLGKHRVLAKYLEAWLPIVLRSFDRARFIDAFAGPGEYKEGEEGSPLIALNAWARHKAQPKMKGLLECIFIEKDPKRFDHLRDLTDRRRADADFPAGCTVKFRHDEFHRCISELVADTARTVVPTVVMVDPFGISDTPMESIAQLLGRKSTEVYISVMMEHINRLAATDEFAHPLDDLYGCQDWRSGLELRGEARREFFNQLYERQLRNAGKAQYVLKFDLKGQRGRVVYSIFFASNHELGCDKMKQAMWRVDQTGAYQFRGRLANQFEFAFDENLIPLKRDLLERFGMTTPVQVRDIERFMRSDATLFHAGQYRKALREMEREGALRVVESSRNKKGDFPTDTLLEFTEKPVGPPTLF